HLAATRGCSLEIARQAAGTSQRSSSTHSAPRVQLSRWAGSSPRLHYLRSVAEGLPGRLEFPRVPICPHVAFRPQSAHSGGGGRMGATRVSPTSVRRSPAKEQLKEDWHE